MPAAGGKRIVSRDEGCQALEFVLAEYSNEAQKH